VLRHRRGLIAGADTAAQQGATLYSVQLGLNLAWMPLFFGLERPIEAAVDILALAGTTGYLTYVWSKFDEVASGLMVPYLAWLGFATYLSVSGSFLNYNAAKWARLVAGI